MVKGFRQIAFLTIISRVFGLVRDMAFAYFLGAGGLMDSWVIAFKIPNLTRRLFGEGAASASFIPVYSQELQRDPKSAQRLANSVVTVVFLILAGLVLLGEAGVYIYYKFFSDNPPNKLMLELTSIMLPYMILICVVAIFAGILNTHRHFAAPAIAPIILNIFIIGSLCFSGWVLTMQPAKQVFFVAVAIIIAGVIQIAIQIIPLRKRGISIRPGWDIHSEAFKKILIMMGPMILGLTVTQINTLADDIIARCLSGSVDKGEFFTLFSMQIKYPVWDGAVSQLYYSQRLYQFPLGVLGISLATAIFPVMSADAARKDFDALKKTIRRGICSSVFVSLPATVGLIMVAIPLVSVLFERGKFTSVDTKMTAMTLSFYAIGLCGYFCQQMATRAFYSVQDSKFPAWTALLAVFVNILLNLTLIWFMGTAGLALSTAICSYLQVVILILVLRRRFGSSLLDGLGIIAIKSLVGTVVMGLSAGAMLWLTRGLPSGANGRIYDVLRLALLVLTAVSVYYLVAKILKNQMLGLITGTKKAEQL